MLIPLAPTTLAFAPGPEDLEECYFGAPEIAGLSQVKWR